jgi:hypothetical protein
MGPSKFRKASTIDVGLGYWWTWKICGRFSVGRQVRHWSEKFGRRCPPDQSRIFGMYDFVPFHDAVSREKALKPNTLH